MPLFLITYCKFSFHSLNTWHVLMYPRLCTVMWEVRQCLSNMVANCLRKQLMRRSLSDVKQTSRIYRTVEHGSFILLVCCIMLLRNWINGYFNWINFSIYQIMPILKNYIVYWFYDYVLLVSETLVPMNFFKGAHLYACVDTLHIKLHMIVFFSLLILNVYFMF